MSLECFLNIVRALGMGSCLSWDGSSAVSYTTAPSSPSSSSSLKGDNSRKIRRNSSLEMWLHRIPGRIFLNGSADNASLFTRQGKKGINQDAMVFWEVNITLFYFFILSFLYNIIQFFIRRSLMSPI